MALVRAALKKLAAMLLALSEDASPPVPSETDRVSPRPLAEMRGSAPTVVAGSIQLLGMAEIKRSLGARWSAVADGACRIAEQTIQRRLSDGDAYQRHGEESFVLCFASPDRARAEATAKAIADEIASRLASQAPEAQLRVGHTVAELEWAEIDRGEGSIVEVIARELRQVREKAEAAARAWRQDLLLKAEVRFGPIWSPRQRVIAAYRAMLDEQTGRLAMKRLASVSTPEEFKVALHELDCLIVGRSIQALDKLLHGGGQAQVLIPVNFNSLSGRTARERYLRICRDIPRSYARFIMFELHGAAARTPVARLVEIALALKPHSHGVLVETPSSGAQLQELASARMFGLSVDAKALPRNPSQAAASLTRLVAAATALNLKVYMHGADTVGSLEAAQKANVDHVDGRAVAFPLLEPRTAQRWEAK